MSYFRYDLDTGISNQLCENIIKSITFRELFLEEFQYDIKDLINDELASYCLPRSESHINHSGSVNRLEVSPDLVEDYIEIFLQSLTKKLEELESKFISCFEADMESSTTQHLSESSTRIQELDDQMSNLRTDFQEMLKQYSGSEIHRLLIEESAQEYKKRIRLSLSSLEDRLIRRVEVTADEVRSNLDDLLEKQVNDMAAEIHEIMDEKVKRLTRLTYSNIKENKIEDRVVEECLQEVLSEDFLRQEIITPVFSQVNKQYKNVFEDLVKKQISGDVREVVREQVEQSIRTAAVSRGESLEQFYYSCIIEFVINKLESEESYQPFARDIIRERLAKHDVRSLEKIIEGCTEAILKDELTEHNVVERLISSEYFLDRLGFYSAQALAGDIKTAEKLNTLLQKQTEKSYSVLLNNLINNPDVLRNLTAELSKAVCVNNPELLENLLRKELRPVIKEYVSGVDSLEKILDSEKAINLSIVSKNSDVLAAEVNKTMDKLLRDYKKSCLDIEKLQGEIADLTDSNNGDQNEVESLKEGLQTVLMEIKNIKKDHAYISEKIESLEAKASPGNTCQVTLKDIVNCFNESADLSEKDKIKKELGNTLISILAENQTRGEMGMLERLLQKRAKKYDLQNLLNNSDFQLIYREKLAQLTAEYQLSKWSNQNEEDLS